MLIVIHIILAHGANRVVPAFAEIASPKIDQRPVSINRRKVILLDPGVSHRGQVVCSQAHRTLTRDPVAGTMIKAIDALCRHQLDPWRRKPDPLHTQN